MRATAILGWAILVTGCYAPDLHSRDLACTAGQCPDGYYCAEDRRCWKQGDIVAKWESLGGAGGPLGRPLAAPTPPDGARAFRQDFEHGTIWWTPAFGLHAIVGDFYDKWRTIDGLHNIGYPIEDQWQRDGSYQRFQRPDGQGGELFEFGIAPVVHFLWGGIYVKWVTERDPLRQRPITDELPGPGATHYSRLEDGSAMVWKDDDGAFWVDPELVDAVLTFMPCIGGPTSDTLYDREDHYWSKLQVAENSYLGIHDGALVVVTFTGRRVLSCPE